MLDYGPMPVSYSKAPQIAGNPKEAEQYVGSLVRENEKLSKAVERAIKILDRNLGHQTEKCYDALAILRASLEAK